MAAFFHEGPCFRNLGTKRDYFRDYSAREISGGFERGQFCAKVKALPDNDN
jgi:hypothetical protein